MEKEKIKKIVECEAQLMSEIVEELKDKGNEHIARLLSNASTVEPWPTQSELYGINKEHNFCFDIKTYEPIRNNRFTVIFPSEFKIQPWWFNSITMPKLKNGKWENIIATMKSCISPSTTQALLYNLANKEDFEFNITMLDPSHKEIQKWEISIKKIISIDFGGTVKYSDDGVIEIKIELETKNCILNF